MSGINKRDLKRLVEAAQSGNADAQVDLGYKMLVMACNGYGKEAQIGLALLAKAAGDHDSARAQYILGSLFQEGFGEVNRDEGKAAFYLTLAALKGHTAAKSKIDTLLSPLGFSLDEAHLVISDGNILANLFKNALSEDTQLSKAEEDTLELIRNSSKARKDEGFDFDVDDSDDVDFDIFGDASDDDDEYDEDDEDDSASISPTGILAESRVDDDDNNASAPDDEQLSVDEECRAELNDPQQQAIVDEILAEGGSEDQEQQMLEEAERLLKQWQKDMISPAEELRIQMKADAIIQAYKDAFIGDFEATKPFAVQLLREQILHFDADWVLNKVKKGGNEARILLSLYISLEKYGIKKNRKQSLFWLKLAANQGYARALHFLGMKFLYGDSTLEVDRDKGLALIRVAAKHNCEDALYQLYYGYMYGGGMGLEQNKLKARYFLTESAIYGNQQALEMARREPDGIGIDLPRIKRHYKGNTDYSYLLGALYINPGVCELQADISQGMDLLVLAANADNRAACYVLGNAVNSGMFEDYFAEDMFLSALELDFGSATSGADEAVEPIIGFTFTVADKVLQDTNQAIELIEELLVYMRNKTDEGKVSMPPNLYGKMVSFQMKQFLYDLLRRGTQHTYFDIGPHRNSSTSS